MITLKDDVIAAIKKSKQLKNAIQTDLDISHTTLYKYLNTRDAKLANVSVINILTKNGFKKSEILTT